MSSDFSYTKYMLLHKIPKRFLQIILPEIIISLILYAGNKFGFFPSSFYYVGLLLGLVIYWIITWILVARDSENTHTIGHYYICNISAFALFSLISGIVFFIIALNSDPSSLSIMIFCLLFCLVLAPACLYNGYGIATLHDFPISFLIFFGITFIIIMIQPLIQFLFESAYAHNITRNVEMHNEQFKEMEEALENSEFKK